MKLLMFGTGSFWYKPHITKSEAVEIAKEERAFGEALVIFIHVEKEDEGRLSKVVAKALDNIVWLARKIGRRSIVLHSFSHLSSSKASIEVAEKAIREMEEKFRGKGYEATITPFGQLLEFKIYVLGESLGKVWKEI